MIPKWQLRTRTLQIADAVDSSRWDTTPGGEVDQHIGQVMDREWRRILAANETYNVDRKTVTSDVDGYYAISDLTTVSGDNTHRFNRVIAFAVDGMVYEESHLDRYLIPTNNSPQPQKVWYFEGQKILALPTTPNQAATVIFNWLPSSQLQLLGEFSPVNFPDGYENIIAWSAASKLLNKAGSEAGRAQVLELQAEALRDDMLQDIMRRSTAPVRMRYTDSTWDYGG